MAVQLDPATSASGGSEAGPLDQVGGHSGDHRWFRVTRQWPAAVCCGLYVVLATMMYGHFGSLGSGHMAGIGSMDSIGQIWWLAWAAHALPDVHNLFLAQGQNYPFGANFGQNVSMLAIGVVLMPITKLFGPVVAWNIALRLAVAVSAASMCLVLRRWTTWWPAAFLGGLLYGFSAYTTALGDSVFLIFVALPPLIFLLLHEIVVRQKWRPGRTGVLLGLVCAVQFFISTEVLASTMVMGAIAVVLLVFVHRRTLAERWRYAATAFAFALGVVLLLLIYPAWFTFAGPQHISGPPVPASYWATYLPVDLLSLIIPGTLQWFDPSHLAQTVQLLHQGELLYLGLPLIVVLVCFAVFFRKKRVIFFAGAMAVFAFVLSLGPRLWIDGHVTQIPLPFALFAHLPALDGFQIGRFALFTDLFAAGMFAIGIDELWKRLRQSRHLARLSPRWSTVGGIAVVGAIVVMVALPLLPSHTQPASPTNVPTFFTSTAVDSIPPGSVVLAYPYPDGTSTGLSQTVLRIFYTSLHSVMLDQAVAGMRYNLIGGFGPWFPSPTGRNGTPSPALLEPQSVQTLFDVALSDGNETATQRAVLSKRNLTRDLRVFLQNYDVETVIVQNRISVNVHGRPPILVGHSASVVRHLTAAIGPPVDTGGVTAWFHVQKRLAAITR